MGSIWKKWRVHYRLHQMIPCTDEMENRSAWDVELVVSVIHPDLFERTWQVNFLTNSPSWVKISQSKLFLLMYLPSSKFTVGPWKSPTIFNGNSSSNPDNCQGQPAIFDSPNRWPDKSLRPCRYPSCWVLLVPWWAWQGETLVFLEKKPRNL